MNEELSHYLGYQFSDKKLLALALTHCSSGDANNERLEFLGDSIVNFVIAEALYQQFPRAQEGDLSRWRASLVNRDALGNLARQLEIGRFIQLGVGELKSGGNERQSILSCTMEALIGALYLDGGFAVVKEQILEWYETSLGSLSHAASHKDPKTRLQEYLQAQRQSLPVYKVESVGGEPHQQLFVVSCSVPKCKKTTTGEGSSRRRAEQAAAEAMLEAIKK
jgi:ribonuclease-3